MRGRPGWVAAATLAAVLGVAGLWVRWSPPGANDLVAGDEGYYGTLARNLLATREQWLSPSLTPLGPPGDKPPLYPALLAWSVAVAGPSADALRWPSLALAVVIALASGGLAMRAASSAGLEPPRWLGGAAALMLMTLPWYGDASRSAMSDIPLTAAGLAALGVVAGGPATAARAAAAGTLLGVAFQCKLWLAGVFVLPALVATWMGGRGRAGPILALLSGLVGIGGLHLAAVAIADTTHLAHWIDVYWRRYLVERVGDAASVYARPPGYYASLLAHALVMVLPLAGLGLDRLWVRRREPMAALGLTGCAAVLPLSLFAVKSAVYLYALLPAWGIAAAVGAAAIAAGAARPGPFTAALAVLSAPPIVRLMGSDAPPPIAAWMVAWGVMVAAWAAARWKPAWAPAAAVAACGLAVGAGLARQAQRLPVRYHDPGYRVVAERLGPVLADRAPGRASFVAAEAPVFAYHLFRTGRYWGTPLAPWTPERREQTAADPDLRAFVIDPAGGTYGGWPDSATVRWLESSTREVTKDIEAAAGRRIAVRVFVRE